MTCFILCCFIFSFIFSSVNSDLVIDVHPSTVLPGQTPSLVVNCSLSKNPIGDIANITSLVLSRYNKTEDDFDEILTLIFGRSGHFSLKEHLQLKDVFVNYGSMYVSLTLMNPTPSDATEYKCDVRGQTSSLVDRNFTEKYTVQLKEQSVTDLLDQICRLRETETKHVTNKSEQETSVSRYEEITPSGDDENVRDHTELWRRGEFIRLNDLQLQLTNLSKASDVLINTMATTNDDMINFGKDLKLLLNKFHEMLRGLTSQNVTDVSTTNSSLTASVKYSVCVPNMTTQEKYVPVRMSINNVFTEFMCDTKTDGGGWIIFQKRKNNDTDFYRMWEDYKNGFGSVNTDYWLGNEKLYQLTSTGNYKLRIELNIKGNNYFAEYSSFSISSELDEYKLTIGSFSGNTSDHLTYHNNYYFTTRDRDNDNHESYNCAIDRSGAWWYNACVASNLNGLFNVTSHKGMIWGISVQSSEMKIKKK